MIIVIIAGGSGTRLWPLSTPDYPKHLLKINGDDRSLVQKTYDRAKRIAEEVYVLTEASHSTHVKQQLPDLDDSKFIIEPARRGTASCIVAALAHLGSVSDPDEPIAVLSADHHIRDIDGFAHSFRVAAEMSKKHGRIVLVGVEPDYPATGFGYIEKDKVVDEESFVFSVKAFKEKPDHERAKQYLSSGNYLWNCGYFVGSVNTFKSAMSKFAPGLLKDLENLSDKNNDYETTYLGFKNESIDYALIEHVENLMVVPASFDWMDLGSYADLHKAAGSNEEGNYLQGSNVELESVENSFVYNETEQPVVVIGLDNVAVVKTKKGTLVMRKDLSQKVGEVSKRINSKKLESNE